MRIKLERTLRKRRVAWKKNDLYRKTSDRKPYQDRLNTKDKPRESAKSKKEERQEYNMLMFVHQCYVFFRHKDIFQKNLAHNLRCYLHSLTQIMLFFMF